MKKMYWVTTPTGLAVFEGSKRECKTYIKQANKKGAEKLYKLEIVEAENEKD